jgi:hypothetical protein
MGNELYALVKEENDNLKRKLVDLSNQIKHDQ